jgi:hypothetical protein
MTMIFITKQWVMICLVALSRSVWRWSLWLHLHTLMTICPPPPVFLCIICTKSLKWTPSSVCLSVHLTACFISKSSYLCIRTISCWTLYKIIDKMLCATLHYMRYTCESFYPWLHYYSERGKTKFVRLDSLTTPRNCTGINSGSCTF